MSQKLVPGFPYKEVYKASIARYHQMTDDNQITDDSTIPSDKAKKAAKTAFDKFTGQLPIYSGTFILIGIDKQGKEKFLSVCKFTMNARLEFKSSLTINGEIISRLDWLNHKVIQHNLKQIIIKPARYQS